MKVKVVRSCSACEHCKQEIIPEGMKIKFHCDKGLIDDKEYGFFELITSENTKCREFVRK